MLVQPSKQLSCDRWYILSVVALGRSGTSENPAMHSKRHGKPPLKKKKIFFFGDDYMFRGSVSFPEDKVNVFILMATQVALYAIDSGQLSYG